MISRHLQKERSEYLRWQAVINRTEASIRSNDLSNPAVWFEVATALIDAGFELHTDDQTKYLSLKEMQSTMVKEFSHV